MERAAPAVRDDLSHIKTPQTWWERRRKHRRAHGRRVPTGSSHSTGAGRETRSPWRTSETLNPRVETTSTKYVTHYHLGGGTWSFPYPQTLRRSKSIYTNVDRSSGRRLYSSVCAQRLGQGRAGSTTGDC